MKKSFLIILSIFFTSALFTSCKTHGPNCAAYSKVEKIKSDKSTLDKTHKQLI